MRFSIFICSVLALPILSLSKSILQQNADDLNHGDMGPNCHMCEVMLNNVRYEYRNNFTDVTVDQLKFSLYVQCDMNTNGFTDQECHRKVDQDAPDILQQLKDGKNSYRICQQEGFC